MECRLVQNVDTYTLYDNLSTTPIGFVNNGIMALFSSAQYMINSNKIESIDNDVDIANTILGLVRYSDDYIRSAGYSMILAKDKHENADNNQFIVRRPKQCTRI